MATSRIVLATGNRHKRDEIQRVLGFLAGCLLSPQEIGPDVPDPPEKGDSYRENALIKARAFASWSGLPALADDSGLEVEALHGRPGLHSSRYAGVGGSFSDNVSQLLAELRQVPEERRGARFVCTLVVCRAEEILFECEAESRGCIALEPRGAAGFGYDPVFIPEGGTRCFAELSAAEKDRISHRGRALEKFAAVVTAGAFPLFLPGETS